MKRLVFLLMFLTSLSAKSQLLKSKLDTFNSILPSEKVYLQTDKPFYNPGEEIWYSVFVLDGQHFTPSAISRIVTVQLLGPRREIASSAEVRIENGRASGVFSLDGQTGGIFTIRAFTNWLGNFGDEYIFNRELMVQSVVYPRLLLKMDTDRKSYQPGDRVLISFTAGNLQNNPLAGISGTYKLLIENREQETGNFLTRADGKSDVAVLLPVELQVPDVIIQLVIEYEGVKESISRAITVDLEKTELTLLPEGGNLLEGFMNTVAFISENSSGKPIDVEGIIRDDMGKFITSFRSYKFGMGSFMLKPESGRSYFAHVKNKNGKESRFELPAAASYGYALHCTGNDKRSISLRIAHPASGMINLIGQIRGTIWFEKKVRLQAGYTDLLVPLAEMPAGILQITLFDDLMIPHAERLVFVNKHKQLHAEITTDKKKYLPREKVKVEIKVKDDKGKPVEGNFSFVVTDDKVISFADDRQDHLLSSLLLSSELKGKIEEPPFYFKYDEPKADSALDLVMMTHGWRRFTWQYIIAGNANTWQERIQYLPERLGFSGVLLPYNYYGQRSPNEYKDVMVSIPGSRQKTKIDSLGRFRIENLTNDGPFSLKVRKGAYSEMIGKLEPELYFPEKKYSPGTSLKITGKKPAEEKQIIKNVNKNKSALADRPNGELLHASPPYQVPGIVALRDVIVHTPREPGTSSACCILRGYRSIPPAPGLYSVYNYDHILPYRRSVFSISPQHYNPNRKREFYSPRYEGKQDLSRRFDFRKTIYWNHSVKTDENGTASIEFYNSDEISAFRCILEGVSIQGLPGRVEFTYHTGMPFNIEANIPPVVMAGDKIKIPVVFRNNTDETLSVNISGSTGKFLLLSDTSFSGSISISPHSFVVRQLSFHPTKGNENSSIQILGEAGGLRDEIVTKIRINSSGFAKYVTLSGNKRDGSVSFDPGAALTSVTGEFNLYTDLFEELNSAMAGMIREPHGCFEQVSSSNYPNIIALEFLKENQLLDAELSKRAYESLKSGYSKLAKYETPEGGFSLWGKAPGNVSLTAMGLLQFFKMKKLGIAINEKMFERALKWLLSKSRNGNFYSDGYANPTGNAYITWALSSIGQSGLDHELTWLQEHDKPFDFYRASLMAGTFFNLGKYDQGEKMLVLISDEMQKRSMKNVKAETSLTASGGLSLNLECLSLYAIAAMNSATVNQNPRLTELIEYIYSKRDQSGRFGSTQSTVLALEAISRYSRLHGRVEQSGSISIYANGKIIKELEYVKGQKSIRTSIPTDELIRGLNNMSVVFNNTNSTLPYSLSLSWRSAVPENSKQAVIRMSQNLSSEHIKTGETVRMQVKLENTSKEKQGQSVAILGIPAGLSVQMWQLKKLMEEGYFDFFELKDDCLMLYYTEMDGGKIAEINFDLKADIPGIYYGKESVAYLYYTDELKHWQKGVNIQIAE